MGGGDAVEEGTIEGDDLEEHSGDGEVGASAEAGGGGGALAGTEVGGLDP